MNEAEIEAGADALCAWLESQNISHDEGAIIMSRVMGSMIATNAISQDDLRRMVADFHEMVASDADSSYLIRLMKDGDK
jgi:hypothetical protein